ncbi:hypothetical protein DPMN_161589 [Dreissena polymorpha]|uniref:Uncharacterized protein n=1 Tax=Dreissena polymorpha TaxID=45954 RepID=A0A9D4EPW4_DREPO|nr:hypothetical protein DPMN_161589 [Dreissena polymorpha]
MLEAATTASRAISYVRLVAARFWCKDCAAWQDTSRLTVSKARKPCPTEWLEF